MSDDEPVRRRGLRWKLLAAGLLFGLGLDLVTPSSREMTLLAVLLMVGAAAWFVSLVVGSPGHGVLYRKRREIVLALGTASITVAVVVALALAVRIAPRHLTLENQSYDSDLGWAPPDVTDRVGQRGDAVDPDRDHVVVVGDSIMYGFGVDDDQTAAAQLDRILEDQQVLNIAVSGYSIDQDYLYLSRVLPHMRPKLVVVGIFTGNDYEVTGLEYAWGHSKPLFRAGAGGELVRHNPDLLADNCIDHLAQSLLFRVLWSDKERALDLIHLFCDPVKLGPEELEAVIAELFARMEAEAAQAGAKILFVLLPIGEHLKSVERNWRYFRRYDILRQLLRDGGHEYFDFYRDILAETGEAETDVFLDGAHLTPNGNRILAEAIAREIDQRGLLDE